MLNQAAQDAIDRAGQTEETNVDDLIPLVGDVNKVYLQLFNNLERLSAIKASYLARDVREKASAGSLNPGELRHMMKNKKLISSTKLVFLSVLAFTPPSGRSQEASL